MFTFILVNVFNNQQFCVISVTFNFVERQIQRERGGLTERQRDRERGTEIHTVRDRQTDRVSLVLFKRWMDRSINRSIERDRWVGVQTDRQICTHITSS